METLTAARGSAPPFLPTMLTALGIGLLSLMCRAPDAVTSALPTRIMVAAMPLASETGHPVLPDLDRGPSVHAAIAFARLHPPSLQPAHGAEAAPTTRATAARRATARSLRTAARRACGAPHCTACGAPHCTERPRTDTAARGVSAPIRGGSEPAAVPSPVRGRGLAEEDLPTGALPFATPTVSWLGRVIGSSVGDGNAALGNSAAALLASAR